MGVTYYLHRQAFVRDVIPLEHTCSSHKGRCLLSQQFYVDVCCFAFHLEECSLVAQLIFCHYVNLILAFAVPPSTDASVGLAFDQYTLKIA